RDVGDGVWWHDRGGRHGKRKLGRVTGHMAGTPGDAAATVQRIVRHDDRQGRERRTSEERRDNSVSGGCREPVVEPERTELRVMRGEDPALQRVTAWLFGSHRHRRLTGGAA